MESIKELADDIYREKVVRARRSSPGAKLFDSLELFEFACSWTEAGIRSQHPHADDQEVKRILRARLDWKRRQEAPQWKPGGMLLP
jgi:hypothetical protein